MNIDVEQTLQCGMSTLVWDGHSLSVGFDFDFRSWDLRTQSETTDSLLYGKENPTSKAADRSVRPTREDEGRPAGIVESSEII